MNKLSSQEQPWEKTIFCVLSWPLLATAAAFPSLNTTLSPGCTKAEAASVEAEEGR